MARKVAAPSTTTPSLGELITAAMFKTNGNGNNVNKLDFWLSQLPKADREEVVQFASMDIPTGVFKGAIETKYGIQFSDQMTRQFMRREQARANQGLV
jgi:hypothetical protein